jgi:hypothetical protein
VPDIMEITGVGTGGGEIATELAQITRDEQFAPELAQMAHVSGGWVVSAHGTGRQEIAEGFSEV